MPNVLHSAHTTVLFAQTWKVHEDYETLFPVLANLRLIKVTISTSEVILFIFNKSEKKKSYQILQGQPGQIG